MKRSERKERSGMNDKRIFLLLEDKEVTTSIKKIGDQLNDKGKQELGKLLSNIYQHGYIDCINDIASQNHISVVGVN